MPGSIHYVSVSILRFQFLPVDDYRTEISGLVEISRSTSANINHYFTTIVIKHIIYLSLSLALCKLIPSLNSLNIGTLASVSRLSLHWSVSYKYQKIFTQCYLYSKTPQFNKSNSWSQHPKS